MTEIKRRMRDQLAADREMVARQTGDALGEHAAVFDGGIVTAPAAADTALAAGKRVRHRLAEDAKRGLKKLVGAD
jgi:hypothetical protein